MTRQEVETCKAEAQKILQGIVEVAQTPGAVGEPLGVLQQLIAQWTTNRLLAELLLEVMDINSRGGTI